MDQEISKVIFEPWIPFFGSIVIAIVLIITMRNNQKAIEKADNTRFVDVTYRIDSDLSNTYKNIENISKTEEKREYIFNFVKILYQLIYLKKNDKIDESVVEYFSSYFSIGLMLIQWSKKQNLGLGKYGDQMTEKVEKWCNAKKIASASEEEYLPPSMRDK